MESFKSKCLWNIIFFAVSNQWVQIFFFHALAFWAVYLYLFWQGYILWPILCQNSTNKYFFICCFPFSVSSIISTTLLQKAAQETAYCTGHTDWQLWDIIQMILTQSLDDLSNIHTMPIEQSNNISHTVVSIEKQKFVHKLRAQTCSPHVKQDLGLLWNAVRRRGRGWHTVVLAGKACQVGTFSCSLSPPLQGTIVKCSCTLWLVLY